MLRQKTLHTLLLEMETNLVLYLGQIRIGKRKWSASGP